MTPDDIRQMVGLQLGRTDVRLEDQLFGDLGAESMDLVHLAVTIEDRFEVFIPEEELAEVRTVHDIYTLVRRHLDAD